MLSETDLIDYFLHFPFPSDRDFPVNSLSTSKMMKTILAEILHGRRKPFHVSCACAMRRTQ